MFLGVDGGGTKTAFVLIDTDGRVLSKHQETTCYHIEVGLDGARKVLSNGINAVLAKADKQVEQLEYAFLGLPALGEDSDLEKQLSELPKGILPNGKYQCDNDMVNGWAAAFGASDGINIIAGTGSIAYGVRLGVHSRCGGWGELFGDEGSAYWIGCKGLTLFSRMSDNRSVKGPLYHLFKQELQIHHDLDLSALVHTQWQGSRGKIAQLSTLVYAAALEGDKSAQAIFIQAANELADIVIATSRELGFDDHECVPLSYSGGAFSANELILRPLTEALSKDRQHYHIQKPLFTPDIGAAIYAAKLAGVTLSKKALDRTLL